MGCMSPAAIIARKRDGHVLTESEIQAFIRGVGDGSWASYQTSALLMAIFLKGMTPEETAALTMAMLRSGREADHSAVKKPKVDKHSTGGVGDKVSLVLAPLVAACGIAVPMISGRGLGHTGGTLDKLEAIPGFNVGLSLEKFHHLTAELGVCLIGQTAEIAPADRALYSLRDVTATVESIPLICASILSKKFAEGIDALVLDVKFGAGAFMREEAKARELAEAMVAIGKAAGKPVRALLTSMEQPLGQAVGNAVEVAESIECLKGAGAADLMEVTLALSVQMLLAAGRARTEGEASKILYDALASGAALEKFRAVIEAQGGDPRVIDNPALLPQAPVRIPLLAERDGYVSEVAARPIAELVLSLGAGRRRAEDTVNPAVGLTRLAKVGQRIRKGDTLALLHAASEAQAATALPELARCFVFSATPVASPRLFGALIGA